MPEKDLPAIVRDLQSEVKPSHYNTIEPGDPMSLGNRDLRDIGALDAEQVYLGQVSSTPTDAEIGSGNTAFYAKTDGNLYKKPYGGSESQVGGGASFPASQDLQIEKSRALGTGTSASNLTFNVQNVWRDVMPNDDYSNIIEGHHTTFDADLLTSTKTNYFSTNVRQGSASSKSINAGELTVTNNTASGSEEWLATGHTPAGPHACFAITVESWTNSSNASNPFVGLYQDNNNLSSAIVDTNTGELKVFEISGGTVNGTVVSSSLPTPPFDLLFMVTGDRGDVFTRERDSGWVYHGSDSLSFDFYDRSVRESFKSAFAYYLADTNDITISDFRAFTGAGVGIRNPHPVTYVDGTPFVRDNKLYFTASTGMDAASIGQRETHYNWTLDLETYEVEPIGILFNESRSGFAYNDFAGHVVYDDRNDEFIVLFAGWGTYQNGPDSSVEGYVGKTETDILHGVHTISTDNMGLPQNSTNTPGNNTDPFLIYDDSAGAYRVAVGLDGSTELGMVETTDDSLTSGWTTLYSQTWDGSNRLEGATITKVNGTYVTSRMDQSYASNMATANYPDITSNVSGVSVDRATGGAVPWGTLVPVYDSGETRYLLITMDDCPAFGMESGDSKGNLWVYEADQTVSGYEFPSKSVYR